MKAGVDEVGHGAGLASLFDAGLAAAGRAGGIHMFLSEGGAGRVEILGVDMPGDAGHLGQRGMEGALSGLGGLGLQAVLQRVDLVLG